jgi:hypothetical protein
MLRKECTRSWNYARRGVRPNSSTGVREATKIARNSAIACCVEFVLPREPIVVVVGRILRHIDVIEADAVERQCEIGGTGAMREAAQRLVDGLRFVLEPKHREARVAHHRLDQEKVVADSCHVAQCAKRALEVVEDAVAEHDVEPAEVLKTVLNVGDACLYRGNAATKLFDVLRARLRDHDRAAALDEEASQMADAGADLEDGTACERKVKRGKVFEPGFVEPECLVGVEALDAAALGQRFRGHVSADDQIRHARTVTASSTVPALEFG